MRAKSRRFRTGLRLASLLALIGGMLPAVQTAAMAPAQAAFGISQRKGIDGCTFSNNTQTHSFWSGTPYYNLGIYLGGVAYGSGCSRSSCVAGVRAFVGGFVQQMHLPPAQKAGFYGSSCASGIYL